MADQRDIYTPNSNKSKNIQKVIKGNAVARKKSTGKKVMETFIGEDVGDIKSYIIFDVIVPAIKDTLVTVVSNGIEMLMYGRVEPKKKKNGGTYVSYDSIYKNAKKTNSGTTVSRTKHTFDDIILESRGEAEEVLSSLIDIVEEYNAASVDDLYNLVGITSDFTNNKFGWYDLSNASTSRVRGGYILNLPKPVVLD